MALSKQIIESLQSVATGTVTTVLLKKGIRRSWMRGPVPLREGQKRIVGPAFTLRFVPMREDLATPESWGKPISTRAAIEAMPEGVVAVADAMGLPGAGIFGDILVARMVKRGVAALVTDGAMRDKAGLLRANLPLWCAGMSAPASVHELTFVGWQEPIGCGGAAIFPDDVIVADDDGAVVIPQALVEEVTALAVEQEAHEAWVVSEVERGVALPGLYPSNAETLARYERDRKKR
jgi:regulator of RNase E activity RraA